MITNIILFKLKEKTGEKSALVKEKLLSLKGAVPQLKDIRLESNARTGPTAFDIVMIATYDSMKDFEDYIAHPTHVEVGKFVVNLCVETASACYET
jgi:hypothetical protein